MSRKTFGAAGASPQTPSGAHIAPHLSHSKKGGRKGRDERGGRGRKRERRDEDFITRALGFDNLAALW